MEQLKEFFEKMMLGTVTRGLMWAFAALAAIGLPVVSETEAGKIATYIVGAIFILVAMFWSKKKNDANKAM